MNYSSTFDRLLYGANQTIIRIRKAPMDLLIFDMILSWIYIEIYQTESQKIIKDIFDDFLMHFILSYTYM